tara:strand:+ start:221 stop:421 length:201 start_codon:yes stop_codon:yes gene_type:complete
MESVTKLESLLYCSKESLPLQTYIEMMNTLTKIHNHIVKNNKMRNDEISCPMCDETINYDDIDDYN